MPREMRSLPLGLAAPAIAAAGLLVALGVSAEERPPPAAPPLDVVDTAAPAPASEVQAAPPAYVPPPGAFSYGTPAPLARVEAEMKRRSMPMMVTGIVLTGLGAVTAIYGGSILAGDGNDCLLLAANRACDGTNQDIVGAVMMVAGGTLVATGLPLLIVGGGQVPVDPSKERATLAPSLLVGPRAGALRWTF